MILIINILKGKDMCRNFLLDRKIDLKANQDIFLQLLENRKFDILIELFRSKILDINSKDNLGKNTLYWAMLDRNTKVVKKLLELNIELNVSKNLNAVNFAVYLDSVSILKCLKDSGINLDICDEINSTPIIYAILYKKKKSIDFLLKQDVNLEHEDFMGNCAKSLLKLA